MVGLFIRYSI